MCKLTKEIKSIAVLALGKIGKEKENRKVYITNKKLQQTFPVGEKVKINYDTAKQQIIVDKADFMTGNHTISKKGNGTPVLDIKGKDVVNTFGPDVEKIEVLFFEDQIVIKVSKTEKFKAQRTNKKGLNTFELFCGGGTLSHFFKRAGFNIKGGLELNQDYLAMFHENNPGEEIYSINGRLEDIHTSYYPKDIDLALLGIPCLTFSTANVALQKALKNKKEGKPYDEKEIQKAAYGESLTFYALTAIRAMNPKTIVVEEVVPYASTSSAYMLRTVLAQMGYKITETISSGSNTKRPRWVLVANMESEINLDNLVDTTAQTIADCLELSVDERDWFTKEEFPPSRLNEKIGIRSCTPNDHLCNTITTNDRRGTEPILKHPTKELYSRFTNREVANIHGIDKSFKLDDRKIIGREILGQGVSDMFLTVAQRIKDSEKKDATISLIINTEISDKLVSGLTPVTYPCKVDTKTNQVEVHMERIIAKNDYEFLSELDPTGTAMFDNINIEMDGISSKIEMDGASIRLV